MVRRTRRSRRALRRSPHHPRTCKPPHRRRRTRIRRKPLQTTRRRRHPRHRHARRQVLRRARRSLPHRRRTRTRLPRLRLHALPIRTTLPPSQRPRHHRIRKHPSTRARRLRSRLATRTPRTLRTSRKRTPNHPRRPRTRRKSRPRSHSLPRQNLDRINTFAPCAERNGRIGRGGSVTRPAPFVEEVRGRGSEATAGDARVGEGGGMSPLPLPPHLPLSRGRLRGGQGEGDRGGQKGGVPQTTTIPNINNHITHPMLTSDILPPRTVSSRGMMAMLKRLEEDSGDNYTFKLVPPPLKVSLACGGNAEGKGGPINATNWAWLPKSALTSPTGLAFLYTKTDQMPIGHPRLAIAPPFPIQSQVRNHRPRNPNPVHKPTPAPRHHPHPLRLRRHRHRP